MSTSVLQPAEVPATPRQQRESLAGPVAESDSVFVGQKELQISTATTIEQALQALEHNVSILQASPYTEIEHCLDLTSVDTPNRLLALALTTLEPSSPKYAITAYPEAFDWPTLFANLRLLANAVSFRFPRTEFYVVDFRSQLKEKIDRDLLFKVDKESHREATASGGLLKYWFGSPDAQRRNLATCLWRNKNDALAGGKGPWHMQARHLGVTTYESISVVGIRLVVDEDVKGWKFEPYTFK